jgi:Undecaprenyl-phosphate glucose phosphotransferase
MLKRYSEVFRTLSMLADAATVAVAWLGAVWLRFETPWFPTPPLSNPNYAESALLLLMILPVWHVLLRGRSLYDARRMRSLSRELRRLGEVTAIGTLILIASTFFFKLTWLSRIVVLLFAGLSAGGLATLRLGVRLGLREARRLGYNQRSVLIVGTGALAREVFRRLQRHPEMGFRIVGALGPAPEAPTPALPPLRGGYEALHALVVGEQIDQVIIALDRGDDADPMKMLGELRDATAAVRIVPDLLGLTTVQSGIEDLDGLPMIRLIESPLLGWSLVLKRALDVVVAAIGLLLTSPVLLTLALAIKLTSPGPVFYRQRRMSIDGDLFEMIKFRSMRHEAESETGPVWAKKGDDRRTPIGAFLRRTNLDELPQLWNVLRGDMSLVGPRPERPEFIRDFRQQMPGYMLRHKVRGGMTGWAQVNGCRGDTSIERRLDYDIEYLRQWSLWLDLKILALTFIRGFRDPNAY